MQPGTKTRKLRSRIYIVSILSSLIYYSRLYKKQGIPKLAQQEIGTLEYKEILLLQLRKKRLVPIVIKQENTDHPGATIVR